MENRSSRCVTNKLYTSHSVESVSRSTFNLYVKRQRKHVHTSHVVGRVTFIVNRLQCIQIYVSAARRNYKSVILRIDKRYSFCIKQIHRRHTDIVECCHTSVITNGSVNRHVVIGTRCRLGSNNAYAASAANRRSTSRCNSDRVRCLRFSQSHVVSGHEHKSRICVARNTVNRSRSRSCPVTDSNLREILQSLNRFSFLSSYKTR